MYRVIFVCILALSSCGLLVAKKSGDELQRKSGLGEGYSIPQPFTPSGDNPVTQPPISTGYYFVDGEDNAGAQWRPDPSDFTDTTQDSDSWRRIISGPEQMPREFYEENPEEGERFFRNVGNPFDSTDNAFAGPIPIGFTFYYNGVRYDSFYVSTNGLIALSNRRYFYDDNGNRVIPQGATSAYDPNSDDDIRERVGAGLEQDDATPDDFGYRYIALGNDPDNPTAGIRNPINDGLADFAFNAPIIAPLWNDMQLSQFDPELNRADDYGKCYYQRSPDGDKLIIYFVNLTPIGNHEIPGGIVEFPRDNRPERDDQHIRASVQAVLNARDSSITFFYKDIQGVVVVNNQPVFATQVLRENSTIGLRGRAMYNADSAPQRYTQFTEYFVNGAIRAQGISGVDRFTPSSNLAIKFKQWKNVVRATDIDILIRDPFTNQFTIKIDEPANYELLIGDPLLGGAQPVATFQNLTNDIQGPNGVNHQPQELSFTTRFRIVNEVRDRVIYNRDRCVDSFALAQPAISGVRLVDFAGEELAFPGPDNLDGVPPYGFVQVTFPAWERSQFLDVDIGSLTAEAIAEPQTCAGGDMGDQWPFDDMLRVRLFGLRLLTEFSDNASDYSMSRTEGPIPSVNKWVNHGAEVVSGQHVTLNPPAPHGAVGDDPLFQLNSPVIRLNRFDLNGNDLGDGKYGGDQLISFPIDMRGQHGAALSFSYQRVGRPPGDDYPRGWSYRALIGPEPRVIQNGLPTQLAAGGLPDELFLEYAAPSPNQYDNILNIPADGWNRHLRSDIPGEYTDNPAISIFGAGGGRRGWSAENPDSALSREQGLESDIYDDGKDMRFRKAFARIPNSVIDAPNDGAKFFRFRLRVNATKNSAFPQPQDDTDDFYVDNVQILMPNQAPDLEVHSVHIQWPYQMTPASQALRRPVVWVANNSDSTASAFQVRVSIFKKSDGPQPSPDNYVYDHTQIIPFIPPLSEVRLELVPWNTRLTSPDEYIVTARLVRATNDDPNPLNDSTFSNYYLEFSDVLAYDPPSNVNHAPAFAQVVGIGLNLFGSTSGGGGFNAAYGPHPANGSGSLAMKFTLQVQDTICGYSALFGALSEGAAEVRFALHRDDNGAPGAKIPESEVLTEPGLNAETGEREFDTYLLYRMAPGRRIVLPPGDYWLSCAQLGTEGLELGASAFRSGSITTNWTAPPPDFMANGTSLNLYKGFRAYNTEGELINDNVFAFENNVDSENWQPFTPTVGNHAYADLRHDGLFSGYRTYSRGTWIPMIRPFFGRRTYAGSPPFDDECGPITPVDEPEEIVIADIVKARILRSYPNPFAKQTTLEFSVPQQAVVRVDILDMAGTSVRTLLNGVMQPAERASAVWNGLDDSGNPVAAGIYLARITIGAQTLLQKIVYIEE